MKRLFLAFGILVVLVIFSFDGVLAATYSGGSGTSGDPYQISSKADLIELSNTSTDWDKHFIQTVDIIFNSDETQEDWDGDGTATWDSADQLGFSPIGNTSTSFTGTYDGDNHIIDYFYINRPNTNYIALFGQTVSNVLYDVVLKNLGLTNVDITGTYRIAALVGRPEGTLIDNCYATGTVTSDVTSLSSWSNAGGLVGKGYITKIQNSWASSTVTAMGYRNGGLVGQMWDDGTDSSQIVNSYSLSTVNGGSSYTGTLVGIMNGGIINNCYTRGNTTRSSGASNTAFGAFVGGYYDDSPIVYNSYSTGNVYYDNTSDPTNKGFSGTGISGSSSGNFFDSETSNQSSATGATAKTTSQMTTQSTFTAASWDFDSVWAINPAINDGYPYLQTVSSSSITAPTTQASELTFSNLSSTQVTLNWTNGNGSQRVVFAKQASSGSATPVQNSTYTANSTFGSGTQISSTGWYAVYNDVGTSVTVTGLATNTDYLFQVVEYNETSPFVSYLTNTATNNPGFYNRDLIRYWNFDEGIGTTIIDSAGFDTGTISGNPQWTSDTPSLTFSDPYAMNFDGADDHITGLGITLPSNAVSVAAWIKPENWGLSSSPNSYISNILCSEGGGTASFCFRLGSKGQYTYRDNIALMISQSNSANDYESTTDLSLNTWTHVAAVFNGSTVKFYVNGSLTNTQSASVTMDTATTGFVIGSSNNNERYFDGSLDELRVYDRAISDDEVAQLAQVPTYTLSYSSGDNGTITGITPQTINGGDNGTSITAIANDHYHFVNWSDGSTNNPRTDTNVNQDIGVTANFFIDTYTLTFSAGSHGSISGTTPQTIDYGADSLEVTAVGDSGYHFSNWSDGNTQNPRQIIGVTSDQNFTASFAADDSDAPVISSVSSNPSSDSATIIWTTDESSSSRVQYGLNQNYGLITSVSDSSPMVTSHSVSIPNLKACARYYYRVISADYASNQSASSQKTFTTTGCTVSTITTGTETTLPVTGGTVQLTNNLSTAQILAPNNYATESATFQINKLDTSQAPSAPSGKSIANNNFYDLLAVTESDDQLDSFDNPVTFTITYGSDTENSFIESTLDVYKYDGADWIQKNCTLDVIANTLTCSLSGFSTYAVLGQASTSPSSTTNNSNSNSSPTTSNSSVCTDSPPVLIPDLFQIDTTSTTAKLFFTPIDTNDFFISFSPNPDAEMYGEQVSLLREGVQSHTIYYLKPYTTYYLKIRGQNGCMPGQWSNAMEFATNNSIYYRYYPKSIITNNNVLGKSTNITPVPTKQLIPTPKLNTQKRPTNQPQSKTRTCFLWWCW